VDIKVREIQWSLSSTIPHIGIIAARLSRMVLAKASHLEVVEDLILAK
jgi:hypothetical protein